MILGMSKDGNMNCASLAELWLKNIARHTGRRATSLIQIVDISRDSFFSKCGEYFPNSKKDDILVFGEEFLSSLRHREKKGGSILWQLYRWVLQANEVDLVLASGCPLVDGPHGAVERWARLIDFFDPDNLVAMRIAEMLAGSESSDGPDFPYHRWPLVVGPADEDLRRLCAMGLSDRHIHMKSLWPVSLSWQRVLRYASSGFNDGLDPERLAAYHPRAASEQEVELIECEFDLINQAKSLVWGEGLLGKFRGADILFFSDPGHKPSRPRDVLAAERQMLVAVWGRIISGRHDAEALEVALDRYLLAKCLFRARNLQSLETTHPGLYAFDVTRKYNSHLGRFCREETGRGGFSEARYRMNNGLLLQALRECATLRRAEVRIAPPDAPPIRLSASYGRGLRAFGRLLAVVRSEQMAGRDHSLQRSSYGSSHGIRDNGPDWNVTTAIHFKRALGRTNSSEPIATLPLLRKLVEFDLQTAALHDYRHRTFRAGWDVRASGIPDTGSATRPGEAESYSTRRELVETSDLLSRIDLASPERGAGPWLIAPYVKLLRGEPDAYDGLTQLRDNPYFQRWTTLHRQGRVLLGFSAPAVGLTCHAGEDYYTLVDGLWHIDGVLDGWKLRAGDGLGHALALATDPSKFGAGHLQRVKVPFGVEFDSLIWLHSFLVRTDIIDNRLRADLESWIADASRHCYSDYMRRTAAITLLELWQKIDRAHLPLPADGRLAVGRLPREIPDGLAQTPGDFLRLVDTFDVSVAEQRARYRSPSPLQGRLADALVRAQKAIVQKITSKGVVIETNPSSNIRMLRLARAADLPILSLLKDFGEDLRVTVCTDNPGVYDTDIETEYGIAFSGLMDLVGCDSRERALRLLRHLRDVGLRQTN